MTHTMDAMTSLILFLLYLGQYACSTYQRSSFPDNPPDIEANTIYKMGVNAHPCRILIQAGNINVNCSHKALINIPILPEDSYEVDLSNNRIFKINNGSMKGQTHLYYLDLSNNPLTYIDIAAFNGLINLSKLFIRQSDLITMDVLYIDTMISDLSSLTEFAITLREKEDNVQSEDCYCSKPLQRNITPCVNGLTRIRKLYLDSKLYSDILKSACNKTTFWNIQTLQIQNSQYCLYRNFNSNCFPRMPALNELEIKIHLDVFGGFWNNIMYENTTFSFLANLVALVVDQQYDSIFVFFESDVDDIMGNISASVSTLNYFKSLSIRGISCGMDEHFSLNRAFSPLYASRSIEYLDISNNGFKSKSSDQILIPESLKVIKLRNNCLGYIFLGRQLINWRTLTTFDARDQNYCIGSIRTNEANTKMLQNTLFEKQVDLAEDNLESIYYTHSIYPVHMNTLYTFTNVKHLDLSWNSNPLNDKIITAELLDSVPNLEFLDLAGFKINDIEEDALIHDRLRVLNLSSNSLGEIGCLLGERFGYLPSLTVLRLDDNIIHCMLKQSFSNMTALEYLDISQNALETFNISLKYLPKLKMLNISNNDISVLSVQTMHEIDHLISANISIDLGKNKLLCNCETLNVLKWLKRYRTHFVDLDMYKCTVKNNSLVYLQHLQFIIFELDRECASYTVLLSLCCVALTLGLSLLVSALSYRYRWKLRYFYYMTRLQIKTKRSNGEYENLYDYDAFISYCSDDFGIARVAAMDTLEG